MNQASPAPRFSLVLDDDQQDVEAARRYFAGKLSFEVDPADIAADMGKGVEGFTLVDTRLSSAFRAEHIEGAINLPVRQISEELTRALPRDVVYVTYCDGPGCNASTKGAARLSALGFKVKEMIGGIEYWKRYGYRVTGDPSGRVPGP